MLPLYSDAINPEILLDEIKHFLPIVQLHWGLWGIIKAFEMGRKSRFDYVRFSYNRFQELSKLL